MRQYKKCYSIKKKKERKKNKKNTKYNAKR